MTEQQKIIQLHHEIMANNGRIVDALQAHMANHAVRMRAGESINPIRFLLPIISLTRRYVATYLLMAFLYRISGLSRLDAV